MSNITDLKKEPSAATYRRWIRNHKSWEKSREAVEQASRRMHDLGFMQRDAAWAHFTGGAWSMLEHEGRISRKEFVKLLDAAYEFGQKTK